MASTHTIIRQSLRALSLLALAALLPAAASAQAGDPRAAPDADFDNDGLTNGFELSRPDLALDPMHADLILVISRLPGVTAEMANIDLPKVVDFFARMPNRNPDGSAGIKVTVTLGNDIPASEAGRPYPELREIGMPRAMRGVGHGLLLGTGYLQGGQDAALSDWSSPSRDWWTIIHELGHQLGLGHDPGGIPSSLYASLMNYDYSFQFNGDQNAVQFSPGKFSSARLDERNLSETLPFRFADLQFLSRAPYNFTLASAGPRSTKVDFNRNGVNGEASVAADINGGTGLTTRERRDLGKTAGGLALATYGDRLVMIYADLPPPVDWNTYAQPGLSVSNPGRLRYQVLSGDTISGARQLASTGVTGEPHAIEAFGQFFVVYPTARGYTVFSYRSLSAVGQLMPGGFAIEGSAPGTQAVLVRTSIPGPEQLYLFLWDSASKAVRWRKVNAAPGSVTISLGPVNELRGSDTGSTTSLSPVRSDSPIGATWDTKIQRIALVTTQNSAGVDGRLKLVQLGRYGDGWYGQRSRWFMGAAAGPVASKSRPSIVHDPNLRLGNFGQYLIYTLDVPGAGTNGLATMSLYRFVPGVTDIWTQQMMLNIWTTSRTAPSAALFRGNIAWGWHVNETFPGDGKNLFQVFLQSNGITDAGITDFDDVTFIATRGLKESLQNATP